MAINELVEDCKDIWVEHSFTSRWALIEGYHAIGERIIKENGNTEELVQHVAVGINRSTRSVYYAVQFAQKFPSLNLLPEGKNTLWRDIVHKYLPEPKEDKPEKKNRMVICPSCGLEFPLKKEKII